MTTLERLRQSIPHYVIRNNLSNKFAIVYHGQVCAGGVWAQVDGKQEFIEEDDLNTYWTFEV